MPGDQSPAERIRACLDEAQVVTLAQAAGAEIGATRARVRWLVERGRWQRLHPGVYLTSAGAPTWAEHAAGALLAAGPQSALSHHSAATVHALASASLPIHVTVPHHRHPDLAGVSVHRTRHWVAPRRVPAVTSVETTVVDLCEGSAADDVAGWVTAALRARLTTPGRLRADLARRPRHARRSLLEEVLDLVDGTESPLELRFDRDVVRAHRLPRPHPQRRVEVAGTSRRFDRAFEAWQVAVELDGLGHRSDAVAVIDRAKANAAASHGWTVLRFGWPEVTTQPCQVAATVAEVLRARGWAGACAQAACCRRRRATPGPIRAA